MGEQLPDGKPMAADKLDPRRYFERISEKRIT
jgi:hypothetical protein